MGTPTAGGLIGGGRPPTSGAGGLTPRAEGMTGPLTLMALGAATTVPAAIGLLTADGNPLKVRGCLGAVMTGWVEGLVTEDTILTNGGIGCVPALAGPCVPDNSEAAVKVQHLRGLPVSSDE